MAEAFTTDSLCSGMLEEVRASASYMRETTRPRLDGLLSPSPREMCVQAIFLRSLCWMETLARLDRPQDFQAVGTCTRSLLEACVDLIFVDHDDTGELTTKMSDWATSAKFKAAEQAVRFYRVHDQKVPDVQEPLGIFYNRNKALVPNLRLKHWGGGHPDRWTGSDLLSDCRTADGLEAARIHDEVGTTLEEFYETQIRRLNWYIHGSGVAILGSARPQFFYLSCALGLKQSANLAVLISALTMKSLHFDAAVVGMEEEQKSLRHKRAAVLSEQLQHEPSP